jgi:mediator of RNA polymerase II transcription subunit 17
MERVRSKSEKYWLDALKIRHANWGLVAAPLPPGAPSGKSADKSARDFWITFGLTECMLRRFLGYFCVTLSNSSSRFQTKGTGTFGHSWITR